MLYPLFQIRRPSRIARQILRKPLILAIMILHLCWPLPDLTQAAAGDLDATFGSGGKVTTLFSGGDSVFALAAQPDGKIIAVGSASNSDFALARYNNDGSLDPAFGSGGKVTTDFFGNKDVALAVALQPDGKIIAVGSAFVNSTIVIVLARYNRDGSLDATFGSGGKVSGGGVEATAIVIQPDNKIVVGGSALGATDSRGLPGLDFAILRYNSDGSFDNNFGSGGKVTTDFFGNEDRIFGLTLQPDGKIVAAGVADRFGATADFAIARYRPNGRLDDSFGTDGKVTTNFNLDNEEALAITLQPDGKIIAAGRTRVVGTNFDLFDFAIARYNPDGNLDSTFGSGGKVTTDFTGDFDIAHAIALQPNGRIVVAGWARDSATKNLDFGLARYNPNGSLDTSYGSGGKVTTDFFGDTDTAFAAAIQFDGKILVAGLSVMDSISRFAIARYEVSKPRIISASVSGKRLTISGEDFDRGAIISINGKKQSTTNDEQSPDTALISKKGAKKIRPGATVILQVRNTDGALSQEFRFTRPAI